MADVDGSSLSAGQSPGLPGESTVADPAPSAGAVRARENGQAQNAGVKTDPATKVPATTDPATKVLATTNAATTTAAKIRPTEQSGRKAQPPATAAPAVDPKKPSTFLHLVKRLPFTTFYVVVTLVLAVVLGTLWESIEDKSWYADVAYGLPAFEDGRWLTLIWGVFFALNPFYYLFVAGAFAFLTGFSEWVLGTKRTVIICVVYQIRGGAAHRPGVPDLPQFRLGVGGAAGHRDRRRFLRRHAGCAERGERDRAAAVAAAAAAWQSGRTCCSRSCSSGRWPTRSTSSRSR